jgi:hypothetical protein
MSKFYVYELIDPRNGKVFYVGKGQHKRMYAHVQAVKNERIPNSANFHLYNKIKQLLNEHYEPLYNKVFETNDEQIAFNKERELITLHGRDHLCNLTDGGEGQSDNTGLIAAKIWRKRVLNGTNHLSDDAKNRLRQINLGKKQSVETIAKRVSKMIGHKTSTETRLKIASSRIGKKTSDADRLKLSLAKKGRTWEDIFGIEEASRRRARLSEHMSKFNSEKAAAGKFVPWNKGIHKHKTEKVD